MKSKLKVTVGALAGVVVLIGIWTAVSPLFVGTQLYRVVRVSAPFVCGWVVPVGVTIAAIIVAVRALDHHHAGGGYDRWSKARVRKSFTVAGVLALVAGLAMVLPGGPTRSALRSRFDAQHGYLVNLETPDGEMPSYERRLNAVQAENILKASIQDTSAGKLSTPQYSVVDDKPAWCSGGSAQSSWGRVYIRSVICLVEEDRKVVVSEFETRVPSLDGQFSTNLAKYVARLRRGLEVRGEDVRYGITDGKPWAVIAVGQVGGPWGSPRTVPAGVVTIDADGDMAYDSHVEIGEYPVPVVPYGVARGVRDGLNTRSGYWCSHHLTSPGCVKRNQAFEDTSSIAGAKNTATDPNGANPTEFVFRREDGRVVMVTPLTPYGAGRNVVGYLEVLVDEVTAGHIPDANLYEVDAQASYLRIAQVVTATYAKALGYTGSDSSRKIYEITPGAPGEVVAAIGTPTTPEYLVVVDPRLESGTLEFRFCVEEFVSGRQIECRSSEDGVAGQNILDRGPRQDEPSHDEAQESSPTGIDLSEVPTDQLISELARRFPKE